MPKSPDRAKLSRLVDAYDRISEESLGMGDPEFHEIEDQLFDAIIDSPYRAVIKNGNIYIPDSNGSPGEIILVDPAEPEDVDDPRVLNLDKD
ncbi:MAG: hypothetical protein JO344_19330 [Planctomycetaceae bacterium]|nr:hypothetical protein [Planctomycetaceae bacterium]